MAKLEQVSAGLDAGAQSLAKCTRRGARRTVESTLAWIFHVQKPNYWITRANKQMTRVPSPRPDFAQEACFDLHKLFFLFDLNKVWSSESDHIRIRVTHIIRIFLIFKKTPFLCFAFFPVDNTKVHFEQHTKKGVFGTVHTEAYHRYMRPVLSVSDTSVTSVRHQYRYLTLR